MYVFCYDLRGITTLYNITHVNRYENDKFLKLSNLKYFYIINIMKIIAKFIK